MKKINKLNRGLLVLSLLFAAVSFNLALTSNETSSASAWSGTQTSTMGTYYNSVGSENGEALRSKLKSIISSPRSVDYDWSRYKAADEAEGNSNSVLLIYSRDVVLKSTSGGGATDWNREHTFPQSKIGSEAAKDNHHIFAADNKVNGSRGNKLFGEVATTSGNQVKDMFGKLTDNYTAGNYFYPTAAARGEVARATMYLNTIYDYSVTSNFQSVELMIKWHLENPVTNREIYRNNTVHSLQRNRNPYIDHEEWACSVYGDTNAATRQLCSAVAVDPESMTISPTSGTINVGSTLALNATVLPSGAKQTVNWASSNNVVATVNNGVVTPVSAGTVTITATSTVDNSVKASATITVTNIPVSVTGVSLNTNTASVSKGRTLQLTATVMPTNASNKNLTWSSSNTSVATVSNTGLVTAKELGNTNVTVTTIDGSFTATASIIVTAPAASTSITGSFYNSTSDNNGGEGGVTVSNLNNGITGTNAAAGFGGTNVVSSVTSTQGYFPRSGGLAIGSSGSTGLLTLKLNELYHATKVEATFNAAGQDSTVTLGGNGGIKSQTIGTFGTAFSNPSSGTAYVIEFNNPASEITIATSKRTALVELIIHYGEEVVDTSLEDATNWATDFLVATDDGCESQVEADLEQIWQQVSLSYNALSNDAKAIIVNTIPDGDGNTIEEALARYIIIVDKYPLQQFITGLNLNQNNNNIVFTEQNGLVFTIVGTIFLFGIVASFFVVRRKYKIIK